MRYSVEDVRGQVLTFVKTFIPDTPDTSSWSLAVFRIENGDLMSIYKDIQNPSDLDQIANVFEVEGIKADIHLDSDVPLKPKTDIPGNRLYAFKRGWYIYAAQVAGETTKGALLAAFGLKQLRFE